MYFSFNCSLLKYHHRHSHSSTRDRNLITKCNLQLGARTFVRSACGIRTSNASALPPPPPLLMLLCTTCDSSAHNELVSVNTCFWSCQSFHRTLFSLRLICSLFRFTVRLNVVVTYFQWNRCLHKRNVYRPNEWIPCPTDIFHMVYLAQVILDGCSTQRKYVWWGRIRDDERTIKASRQTSCFFLFHFSDVNCAYDASSNHSQPHGARGKILITKTMLQTIKVLWRANRKRKKSWKRNRCSPSLRTDNFKDANTLYRRLRISFAFQRNIYSEIRKQKPKKHTIAEICSMPDSEHNNNRTVTGPKLLIFAICDFDWRFGKGVLALNSNRVR